MKFLNQFIQGTDALGHIRLTTRQLNTLTRKIRATLTEDAGSHLVGCALRSETVVVFIDSPAWAVQFRYFQQNILAACQQHLGNRIRVVQFRILPPEPITGKPPAPGLTENSRQLLQQAAQGITDGELAAALRRLSASTDDQDAD